MPDASVMQKLRHYCAYQERCHSEVRGKCLDLGLRGEALEEAIALLIADNFLNEERFAKAFAGGYFRTRQWGRKKILAALKQRQLSAYCIKVGMKEIDEEDYWRVVLQLAEKKYSTLRGDTVLKRKYKTMQFLIQRGFEPELAHEALEQIINTPS